MCQIDLKGAAMRRLFSFPSATAMKGAAKAHFFGPHS
jgi:hypothetical protein